MPPCKQTILFTTLMFLFSNCAGQETDTSFENKAVKLWIQETSHDDFTNFQTSPNPEIVDSGSKLYDNNIKDPDFDGGRVVSGNVLNLPIWFRSKFNQTVINRKQELIREEKKLASFEEEWARREKLFADLKETIKFVDEMRRGEKLLGDLAKTMDEKQKASGTAPTPSFICTSFIFISIWYSFTHYLFC